MKTFYQRALKLPTGSIVHCFSKYNLKLFDQIKIEFLYHNFMKFVGTNQKGNKRKVLINSLLRELSTGIVIQSVLESNTKGINAAGSYYMIM